MLTWRIVVHQHAITKKYVVTNYTSGGGEISSG